MMKLLIVGLGNPGIAYEGTRHNMGFNVVQLLAKQKNAPWRREPHVKGRAAHILAEDRETILLTPSTFMNCSGEAVRKGLKYFNVPLEHLLVVADDIALPFGELRMRLQGGAGGHNGLKSIEAQLGTQYYSRLRIGIGDREEGDLSDYVLGRFSAEESTKLPEILEKAAALLEVWISEKKGINNG